jgi:hypothetical protein
LLREEVSRGCRGYRDTLNHNPCVGGSNPSSATNLPHTCELCGNIAFSINPAGLAGNLDLEAVCVAALPRPHHCMGRPTEAASIQPAARDLSVKGGDSISRADDRAPMGKTSPHLERDTNRAKRRGCEWSSRAPWPAQMWCRRFGPVPKDGSDRLHRGRD